MSQPPTTDGRGPTGSGGGDFQARMNRLIEISIALSAERKLDVLLERILTSAREITGADAGTLYRLQDGRLHFEVIQNATLGIATGGTTGEKTRLEPVKLDKANVCAYTAILGRTVAIADVYESREFDFSGPRHYDRMTGYRSRSMLVVPMKTTPAWSPACCNSSTPPNPPPAPSGRSAPRTPPSSKPSPPRRRWPSTTSP